MTANELVIAFCEGAETGESEMFYIHQDMLICKGTVMAERYKGRILANITRYSLISGLKGPQNKVLETVPENSIGVNYVPQNMIGPLHELLTKKDRKKFEE